MTLVVVKTLTDFVVLTFRSLIFNKITMATLVDQTLNKINQHWKHEEFTQKHLDEELNNISRSWMNSIKDISETNIWKKLSKGALWTCMILTMFLLIINIGFYTHDLVTRVKLGRLSFIDLQGSKHWCYYFVTGYFLWLFTYATYISTILNGNQAAIKFIYDWIMDFHKRKNESIEKMVDDYEVFSKQFNKCIIWSIISFKLFKINSIVSSIAAFVLVPIVNASLTHDLFYLAPFPLLVPGLNHQPIIRCIFLNLIEFAALYHSVQILLVAVCIFFFILIHMFFIIEGTTNYIAYKKETDSLELNNERKWIANIVDITSDLKE